ncbi:hypothetical protein BHU24_05220 [Bacillus pseudomycoides]|uniref:hypothetical protein n=1 Tax=Bacillus pseudomycoides TaxID=64104 RepID=UPI000BF0CE05|nr:hypothetical protein [Bacillus pseudomycoides]MBD5798395.1 hypothetical protein [Bacillus pseudomycoides]PEN09709.1 hypothetical protein CN640_11725 [Bacillus pseudomycoides]
MDYIINHWTWTGVLSVISLFLSCSALYLNWKNTSINKKKFKNEQDDKKKADIVWEEAKGNNQLVGIKTIRISNIGNSDAKNFQIIINDKELEKIQENDKIPGNGYPSSYSFDGLKLIDTRNNFIPTEISAGLSVSFQIRANPLSSQFIRVKCIWDDEFEERREKEFKYIPGNTKLAN